MTVLGAFVLFATMAALAALPSSSSLLVVAQSAAKGVRSGLATSLGVVSGDLVFIVLAIIGMTALAEQMGAFFVVIKYLAAAYLIWFGIGLLRSAGSKAPVRHVRSTHTVSGRSLLTGYASGLLLTLGDIKAIIFYASLLPTFVDLTALSSADIALVSIITVLAVGGVKAVYAIAAHRIAQAATVFPFQRGLKGASGMAMVGAGTYVLIRD